MEVKTIKFDKNSYFLGFFGFIGHVIVLWGVLDANFHSPVISNLQQVPPPPGDPPAKRLFLFVADGLRYRTFDDHLPPYLGSVMENGTWGISHARMPTESRPGNVAITAGLFEDPSALFRGWKENPVHFDSVFNQSSKTWAWGSPDIVPMFTKGNKGNVHGETYPHDWQDFDKSSNSLRRLDSWVFDKYFSWLENEAKNIKNDNGIILFFHLLGCDTVGHARKPHSREYIESMNYVDQKIKQVVESAADVFGDDKTAFIMTSDHGMTNWGSHGSGSTDETETPIVAWGAGVNNSLDPVDIDQVDIAPLISTLLGISIPVNSEGLLRIEYLDGKRIDDGFITRAVINNCVQLLYQIRANRVKTRGYGRRNIHKLEYSFLRVLKSMESLNRDEKNQAAMGLVDEALHLGKELLDYYRHYQTNQLIFYLTIMWLGWIGFLLFSLAGTPKEREIKIHKFSLLVLLNLIFILILLFLFFEQYDSERQDLRVLGYGIIAVTSVWLASRKIATHSLVFDKSPKISVKAATIGIFFLIKLMSIGLLRKYVFSLAMIVAVLMQWKFTKRKSNYLIITGIAMAVYPLFPPVKPGTDTLQILGVLGVNAALLLIKKSINKKLKCLEFVRMLVTSLIIAGLIDGRSGASWLILLSSPLTIFLYQVEDPASKLTGVLFGFLCPLSLLSASYEPQFYTLLALHLIKLLEAMSSYPNYLDAKSNKDKKNLSPEDLVTSAYFMLYILLSFFGTGNMTSISSFDPMWTRHFITVFSPFTMAALILLKLAIPLILVGCASRAVATSSTSSSSSMFLGVLLLGDCLSLPLIYSVTSKGSWLIIGTAISRYTIAVILPCLFMVLYHLSGPLMKFSFYRVEPKSTRHLV